MEKGENRTGGDEMAGHAEVMKCRVVKVDSEEWWDLYIAQATTQGCPLSSWCMPSVAMNPFFEHLALTNQDVLFLLVDVDEVKRMATKMEIKAMPTFLLMKEGAQQVVDKLVVPILTS